jgi:hypothetical protein
LATLGTFLGGLGGFGVAVQTYANPVNRLDNSAVGQATVHGVNQDYLITGPPTIALCTQLSGAGRVPEGQAMWLFERDTDGDFWAKGRVHENPDGTWSSAVVEIGAGTDPGNRAYVVVAALMSQAASEYTQYVNDSKLFVAPAVTPGAVITV